jgi:hypothetical protein
VLRRGKLFLGCQERAVEESTHAVVVEEEPVYFMAEIGGIADTSQIIFTRCGGKVEGSCKDLLGGLLLVCHGVLGFWPRSWTSGLPMVLAL